MKYFKKIDTINETKSLFFERIKKTDKTFYKPTRKVGEKTQATKFRMISYPPKVNRITRECLPIN